MIKIVFRKIKSPIFYINIALNMKFKENLFPGYKNILGWGYYSRGVFINFFWLKVGCLFAVSYTHLTLPTILLV